MKILLFGKDGQVGKQLQHSLALLAPVFAVGRQEVNFEDFSSLRRCVKQYQPDVIVNAAAYTAVDQAEGEPEKAYCVNAAAVKVLAEEASLLQAWLVHYSTDYIFDGKKSSPYIEEDLPCPLSVYGQTKFAGEQHILGLHEKHLIFRTSWVYSAEGNNFVKTILRLAKEKNELKVVADQIGAPTSANLIAKATAFILQTIQSAESLHNSQGIYHLTASGNVSWYDYAKYLLELAEAKGVKLKVPSASIQPVTTEAYNARAKRPMNSCLNTIKLREKFNFQLPDWKYDVVGVVEELIKL